MTGLDESSLEKEIKALEKVKRFAFGLLLCGRMVPALDKFARETNFDNSYYTHCLDSAWNYLRKYRDSFEWDRMVEKCRDRAPDTEEYDHPLTSAALNAALAIAETISILVDEDGSHVGEVAGLARDTSALYAQAIESIPPNSLTFKEIMNHPLMLREIRQQAEDLEVLKALPTDDFNLLISLLRDRIAETPVLLPPENG